MKTFAIFCISASLSFGSYCQGPPPPPPPGPGPSSEKPSAPTEDDMMMPPPPQPDKTKEASFVEKYQLKTIESGGLVKHSNIFFSMSFKAKEKMTRLNNSYIFRSFDDKDGEEVSLWSIHKSNFTHAEGKEELAHLRIAPEFGKWNLEKMGEYFFVIEDPYKSTFSINTNMKNLALISKNKVVIDGTEFLKLEFKNKDPKNGFVEIKYLTTLGDLIYVINHRKKATDPEDVMKDFRMKN